MKRKLLGALLSTAMVASLAVGCGGNDNSTTPADTPAETEAPAADETPAADAEAPAADASAGGFYADAVFGALES